jgi:hypothetical protein
MGGDGWMVDIYIYIYEFQNGAASNLCVVNCNVYLFGQ